mgnify:FL=1|jgi:hypothetical protein
MNTKQSCPMTGAEIVDRYFLDARSRLLDLAAFLDRLDRSSDGAGRDDYRVQALIQAAKELHSGEFGRAFRIQELLSDPTTEPVEQLTGKGAFGAWDGGAS